MNSDLGEEELEVDEEELFNTILIRYKMTREQLLVMANRMGVDLHNLLFLKREFDRFDEDGSGYVDVSELRTLLVKLGEDLSDQELEQSFRDLDTDGSGEIEFFEFVEWFTSAT